MRFALNRPAVQVKEHSRDIATHRTRPGLRLHVVHQTMPGYKTRRQREAWQKQHNMKQAVPKRKQPLPGKRPSKKKKVSSTVSSAGAGAAPGASPGAGSGAAPGAARGAAPGTAPGAAPGADAATGTDAGAPAT